jgi:hypothetical protein
MTATHERFTGVERAVERIAGGYSMSATRHCLPGEYPCDIICLDEQQIRCG